LKKKISIICSLLLTLFFLYYILVKIEWDYLILNIRNLDYSMMLLALVFYFICFFLRAVRLKVVLYDSGLKINDLTAISLLHNLYNRILPARLGDLSLIYFLKKFLGKDLGSSVSVFIILRIYDLMASVLLLCISYVVVFHLDWIAGVILFILFLLLSFCFLPITICRFMINFLNRIPFNQKFIKKISQNITIIITQQKYIQTNRTRINLFLTSIFTWFFILVFFVFLLESIHQEYGFWNISFASTVANFSWVLPINGVGGFGTMELSWGYAFSLLGFPFNQVILSALFINVMALVGLIIFNIVPIFYLIKKRG